MRKQEELQSSSKKGVEVPEVQAEKPSLNVFLLFLFLFVFLAAVGEGEHSKSCRAQVCHVGPHGPLASFIVCRPSLNDAQLCFSRYQFLSNRGFVVANPKDRMKIFILLFLKGEKKKKQLSSGSRMQPVDAHTCAQGGGGGGVS